MGNSKSTLNNIIHDIDLEMGSLMTSARETGLQQLIVPKDAQNLVFSDTKVDFWTPGLPEGVLSNPPCPLVRPSVRWSVRPWSILKYLRDRSLVFSNYLHEVRAP